MQDDRNVRQQRASSQGGLQGYLGFAIVLVVLGRWHWTPAWRWRKEPRGILQPPRVSTCANVLLLVLQNLCFQASSLGGCGLSEPWLGRFGFGTVPLVWFVEQRRPEACQSRRAVVLLRGESTNRRGRSWTTNDMTRQMRFETHTKPKFKPILQCELDSCTADATIKAHRQPHRDPITVWEGTVYLCQVHYATTPSTGNTEVSAPDKRLCSVVKCTFSTAWALSMPNDTHPNNTVPQNRSSCSS